MTPTYDDLLLRTNRLLAEEDFASVLALRAEVRDHFAKAKLLSSRFTAHFAEWLDERDGEVVRDGVRWYSKLDPYYKAVVDNGEIFDQVLERVSGDVRAASSLLASEAFKYGEVRELLGDELFYRLFERKYRTVVKEGKPRRKRVVASEPARGMERAS